MKGNIVEDIDIYINKIKSKHVPINKNNDKSDVSEQTLEMKSNANNIITGHVDNNTDSENSVINFIKNTKKINQAGTTEKKPTTYEKKEPERKEIEKRPTLDKKEERKPQTYEKKEEKKVVEKKPTLDKKEEKKQTNDKIVVEITPTPGNYNRRESNSKNDELKRNSMSKQQDKSLEDEIKELKSRRASKFDELKKSKNFNEQSDMKIGKEGMIKINGEPITTYYNIISDLGNGSYGMVKKVKHKKLNEERAMKIVKKKAESSINEIEILKKVSHPNIISIYEIFEDSKNYYIMSELLEGGELFEEITNRGSFSEIDAAKIMKQLLSSVYYLHNKNIVHRDLKPENIMMVGRQNTNFEIKLIDFGTAKIMDPKDEKLTKFIGTSYYIAPEVLAENYDERCDVWSAGVILYILYCGYPPFNGASNLDIYHAIKYSSPSFVGEEWRDVSKEAVDLIVAMLTKNPSKRLTADQCLNHIWFNKMEEIEKDAVQKNKLKFNPLKALQRMTDFVTENKFKQTVIQFISTQFNLKEEEESLKNLFEQFDNDRKGIISIEAFSEVLAKYFGENEAKFFAEKIFSNIDNDGNGEISYNEFISSIIDTKMLEKNNRIEKAFKMMDKVNIIKVRIVMVKYP
jgi:calcium-dependent protein kinase